MKGITPVICTTCKHRWLAVAYAESKKLECPKCGSMTPNPLIVPKAKRK